MNFVIALLNFLSGLILLWPAMRLTGDLRSIRDIEKDIKDHQTGTAPMGDDVVDTLEKISEAIKARTQQWDKKDTYLLYIGLGLFIISSFLQIIVALTPTG